MSTHRTLRDGINILVPVAALVLAVLALEMPLPVALLLSLLLFGGMYLVLNPHTETEEERLQLRAEVWERLAACRATVARLRVLAGEIERAEVSERVMRICARAERVIETLARQDLSLASATRLATVFELAAHTLDTYVRASTDAPPDTPELGTVRDAVETEGRLFHQLELELDEWASRAVRDDVVEIEAAIRSLECTLRTEGLS